MGLNYNPTIVPDGLVMYFDPANSRSSAGSGNTIYDLTGNSNTCTFSATPTYDVASKGNLLLAGYGTVPHTSTLWGSNQFTFSVWAKKTSGTRGVMINKDTCYIDQQYLGKTMLSLYTTASYSPRQHLVYGNDPASLNEWRHYAATYDGTVGILYENGAQTGSTSISVVLNNTTAPLYIGDWSTTNSSWKFNGKLGTMMTYNRALSAQEVKQNYDATKGRYITPENIVTNGLVLYVDSSKSNSYAGFGNTIYDLSSSGNTGILTNGPAFSGLNDGSIVFDGVDDYINFGNNSTLQQNSGTLSAWVKASSPGSAYRGIIAKRLAYGLFYLNSVLIAYDWVANTARSTGINIADNTWKNVVLTYQSGVSNGTSIYINGVSVLTTTITIYDQTANLYGGAEANATQFASCQASSFSMYNRALTQQEILQNYNATKSRFGL